MATYTLTGRKYTDKLAETKARKYQEIKNNYEYELHNGSYMSQTIGAEINARLQDIETIRNLIEIMEMQGNNTTPFRLYDNSFTTVTLEQLKSIKSELMEYGLGVHQKKWNLEEKIDNATSIKTVEGISW
jgi:hypothetical protein